MKKSYAGKEGHPPSRVNFSEGLHEKNTLTPLLELGAHACSHCLQQSSHMLWLSCLDRVDWAGRAKVFI